MSLGEGSWSEAQERFISKNNKQNQILTEKLDKIQLTTSAAAKKIYWKAIQNVWKEL